MKKRPLKYIARLLAAVPLALAVALPAQQTMAAPSSGIAASTGAVLTTVTRLDTAPRFGTDVKFSVPAGKQWTNVASDDRVTLDRLHLSFAPGSQILAAWRAPDMNIDRGYPERPFIYIYAAAIPLDTRPEVKSPEDLARVALADFCEDHTLCLITPDGTLPVGDETAVAYSVRDAHRFQEATNVDGYLADFAAGGEPVTTEAECRSQQVFAIKGNWGYQFSLMTTQPQALSSRIADLHELLRGAEFSYQPAAPAAVAPAPKAAGKIARVPVVDTLGDVDFDLPAARGWAHADTAGKLEGIVPLDLLEEEYQLLIERAPVGPLGGAYTYFVATAISLDMRPDIKTATDFAARRFAFLDKHMAGFRSELAGAVTVGGAPGIAYRTSETYRWPDVLAEGEGITGVYGESRLMDEVTWTTQRAFVVHGNWAYEFRMTSTDAGALSARMADFAELLRTADFRY